MSEDSNSSYFSSKSYFSNSANPDEGVQLGSDDGKDWKNVIKAKEDVIVTPSNTVKPVSDIDHRIEWVEKEIQNNSSVSVPTDKSIYADIVSDVDEEILSNTSNIDIDINPDARVLGDIETDGDVDSDNGFILGHVTSDGSDITITNQSVVKGDIIAEPGTNIDIDGSSVVEGDILVKNGSASFDNVTIEGHLYADSKNISCSDSTLIGPDQTPCSEYAIRDQ